MANNFFNNFSFISTRLTIKNGHLNKKDVGKIKSTLSKKLGAVSLLVSIVFLFVSAGLLVSMGRTTNWNAVEVYGVMSLVGQIFGIVGSSVAIVLESIGLASKNERVKSVLSRISTDILYFVIMFTMFAFFTADAKQGFLTNSETLSASVIIITLLIILQPAYWIDALVADSITSIGIVLVASLALQKYSIGALHYYIIIAVIFPFASYLVISILFYAEAQRYCVELRNEALNNSALYDELTHCKNRHALRQFITENVKRWESHNVHLLIIMFDIDNFKEFNDQFSHPGGDYCLKTIAEAIRKAFPSPGLDFFRYGGEEFLLFFELENPEDAPMRMEEVRQAVKGLKINAPKGAPENIVTISVGGTLINTSAFFFSFDEQLKIVDSYLYQAKANGKDVCVFDGSVIEKEQQ